MAYDRYDSRRDERWSDDDRRHHQRGRGEERGFFERAGEELSSWFGGREGSGGERYGRHDERSGRRDDRDDRERDNWMSPRGRFSDRDDRDFAGNTGWSDRDEGFRQSRDFGSDREQRPNERDFWSRHSSDRWNDDQEGRDYRPMAGDYGRSGERSRRFDRDEGRGRFDPGMSSRDEPRRFDRSDSEFDRDEYRRTSFAGSAARSSHDEQHADDPHYRESRRRHMDAFDRDYDDYRRERQSNFEEDFGSWRNERETKRQMLGRIREHMDVVGSDGEHVGTVDRVAGDRIILTKSDPDAGGVHHSLTCASLDRIEDGQVVLGCTAEEARKRWRDESRDRALFEREDQGRAGPHMLDRSFSGTYR